ncbi:hypothetical protein V8G54_028202 [Vigna mungo]|uniref:chloroplast protein-transporting ATPase n=1 Tax=Vigna mungo TaxID=3915 RepID=A0AAQ3MRZ2_VIGMU
MCLIYYNKIASLNFIIITEIVIAVLLSEQGYEDAEEILAVKDLYDPREQWASYILNAIKAKELFFRDVNCIVRGEEVFIVDEFTGRVMQGRRWSDGLHQAVEAKEGLPIQNETVTLASISYQNFFLQFPKLCGMTGTAATESTEFEIVVKISRMHKTGRPVLVGTTSVEQSVEQSDSLSELLKEAEIPHEVYPREARNAILDSKIEQMENKIKMLEGELREAAAIEAALFSVVSEHGSSMSKVHALARRLSRLYLHACKENLQARRVGAARSAVSGLVLVAKACGNDVPRLTFWLSNSIVLRTIISKTTKDMTPSNTSGSRTKRKNGEVKVGKVTQPLIWRGFSPRKNDYMAFENGGIETLKIGALQQTPTIQFCNMYIRWLHNLTTSILRLNDCRVVKPSEEGFVSIKKPPSYKTEKQLGRRKDEFYNSMHCGKKRMACLNQAFARSSLTVKEVNGKLFPCQLSDRNVNLTEKAVQLAVETWGEKGPAQDEVIAKLRNAFLELEKNTKSSLRKRGRSWWTPCGGLRAS